MIAPCKPGFYRGPDGIQRRIPATPPAPVKRPAAAPPPLKPGLPKSDSLRAPMRGQKPIPRKPAWLVALKMHLRQTYPTIDKCLPLKIGILEDLVNSGLGVNAAKRFLAYWVQRPEYHQAVATGHSRYRLDGTVDGEIDPKHKAFAEKQLLRE